MTAKNRIAKYLWTFIKYFSLILAGFIAVLPVASCVITAFKTPEEYASTNVMTLPGKFYFKNFTEAFQKANMGVAFLNSLIILVVVLFFSIMFGAMLAYILNRFTFPGRGIIKNNKSAVGSTALLLLKRGKFMKKIYKRKLCRFLFVYVYTIPFACDQIVSKF